MVKFLSKDVIKLYLHVNLSLINSTLWAVDYRQEAFDYTLAWLKADSC